MTNGLQDKAKNMNQEQELQELKQQIAKYEAMNNYHDNEIDLRELWSVIWQGKWKIIAITAVFAIASVFYALSLPNIYKSEALLMPNSQDQKSGGLGALAGQFGGLASLAGINIGGGGTDKTGYALEVIKSREFLYKFIQDNDLKAIVMGAKGWDLENNELIYNLDIYDPSSQQWLRKVEPPLKPEPSEFEVYEAFLEKQLLIEQDKETGMVKVSVKHYSPFIAKTLVDALVQAINTTIKYQDMDESTKSIHYLEQELENTTVAGAQTMFYQLIEQQQQTLMLTKVRNDYVLKVVDQAIVPEMKDSPKRALICVLGVFVGGIISIILVLIRYFVKSGKYDKA